MKHAIVIALFIFAFAHVWDWTIVKVYELVETYRSNRLARKFSTFKRT